jgi:hypothetical protein
MEELCFDSQQRQVFHFAKRPDRMWGPSSLLFTLSWEPFLRWWSDCGVKFVTHLQFPRLSMGGNMYRSPLHILPLRTYGQLYLLPFRWFIEDRKCKWRVREWDLEDGCWCLLLCKPNFLKLTKTKLWNFRKLQMRWPVSGRNSNRAPSLNKTKELPMHQLLDYLSRKTEQNHENSEPKVKTITARVQNQNKLLHL